MSVTNIDLNHTIDDRYPYPTIKVDDARARVLTVGSTYCDLNEIVTNSKNFVHSKYCALHLNIHSLPAKHVELKNIVSVLGESGITIHFILLCETFLTDINCLMYDIPGYVFIHNSRKSLSRGGVAMYILDNLSFVERTDLSEFHEGEFESIFAEIKGKSHEKNVIVGEIYRPPNTNEKSSIERYDRVQSKISSANNEVIIGTDQNIDYMKINQNKNVSDLFDVFYTQGLLPTATRPTRITHSTATLIYNVYVKAEEFDEVNSRLLTTDISDHLPIIVSVGNVHTNKSKEPLIFSHRPLNEVSTHKIAIGLMNTSWDHLERQSTSNDAYVTFMATFLSILDKHAPMKTVSIPYKSIIRVAWMTSGLLASCRTRNKLYTLCHRQSKDHESYIKYVTYCKSLTSLKKIATENYYHGLLETHKNDIRKTWNIMNSIIGRTRNKTSIPSTFIVNGREETNELAIANSFCDYFTNIGKQYADKIPDAQHSVEYYMKSERNRYSMFLSPVDPVEIEKILKLYKAMKSSGYDGLNMILVKALGK